MICAAVIGACGSSVGPASESAPSVAGAGAGAAGQALGPLPGSGAGGAAEGKAGNASSLGGSAALGGGSVASAARAGVGGSTAEGGRALESPSAGAGGEGGDVPKVAGVPGIIAVGYGGLRVVSRDLGKTWEDETHWSTDGGDDEELLRTIAYGNGVWVSAGWRLVTSTDGESWSDHGMADDVITPINCAVTDGMAFGGGKFLVACGSNLASSSDGLSWTKVGPTPGVGKHPYLFWDDVGEQFVCSGDDGPSFVSPDGKAWTKISLTKAHLCDGLEPKAECASFYTEGVFLTTEWGGAIRRSIDGTSFEKTYQDQFENNLFTEYSFGVGRVGP